jgi:hypothetical protein
MKKQERRKESVLEPMKGTVGEKDEKPRGKRGE